MSDLLRLCPVWEKPCLKEGCISYEVHTKQRFKNIKTEKYVPLDQLSFYKFFPQNEIDETIERNVSIVRECRKLGKIIEINNLVDHLIPSVED